MRDIAEGIGERLGYVPVMHSIVGEGLPEPREPVRIITQRVGDKISVLVKGVTIDEAAEVGEWLAAGMPKPGADARSHTPPAGLIAAHIERQRSTT